MAAPPPPPPPPPPGPFTGGKPENKKLLDSICKGTSLKKVPDSMKNDRSEALLNKPQGTGNSKNNSGPLVPPSNKTMTLAEELAARKNQKATVSQAIPPSNKAINSSFNEELASRKNQKAGIAQIAPQVPPVPPSNKPMTFNEELAARKNIVKQKSNDLQPAPQPSPIIPNPKKSGAPLPNSNPPPVAPPPPSAINKPPSIAQPQAPIKMPMNLPPPPIQTHNPTVQPPPPPLPKVSKPNFRQPIPICSKPTTNGDSQPRGIPSNQFCGPIIPPPPPMLPSSIDIRPPRFAAPPPPPPSTMPNKALKPDAPLRGDSRCDFDSKFTFMEMKYFPDPNTMIKIRQT